MTSNSVAYLVARFIIGGVLIGILATLVAIAQLLQSIRADSRQTAAQATQGWADMLRATEQAGFEATQLANLDALHAIAATHLAFDQLVETEQVASKGSGPTATAAGLRLTDLAPTALVLATEQAALIATATAVPPHPTAAPFWNEQSSGVPASGEQIVRELSTGELLYLSGGRFSVNGTFCGDNANQICILVYEATTPQTVIVDRVIPVNNYLARTYRYSYADLVEIHVPSYWKSPNCSSPTGCAFATIYHMRDGQLVSSAPEVIQHP